MAVSLPLTEFERDDLMTVADLHDLLEDRFDPTRGGLNDCEVDPGDDHVVDVDREVVRLRATAAEETLDDCAQTVTVALTGPLDGRRVVDLTTGQDVPLDVSVG